MASAMTSLLFVAVLATAALAVPAPDAFRENADSQMPPKMKTVFPIVEKLQDSDFECGWRAVAYDYGRALFPKEGSFQSLFDALQLQSLCNQTLSKEGQAPRARPSPVDPSAADASIYVDPVVGSDSNPGTLNQPLKTIPAAVQLSRSTGTKTIILRQGTHILNETVVIEPQDSGLQIVAAAGETPIVSGGIPLKVQWKPFNITPSSTCENNICMFAGENAIYADIGPATINFTRTDTPQQCRDLCNTHPECFSFTWHDSTYPIEWNRTCWFRTDKVYAPTAEGHHYAGCKLNQGVQGCVGPVPPNVYVADLSGQNVGPIDGLHFQTADGSLHRAIRARYPNSNPEFIPVYSNAGTWTAPTNPGCNSQVVDFNFPDNYAGMFQNFLLGVGGTCDVYEADPSSYWCQPGGRTGGKTYCVRSPSGLTVDSTILPNLPYTGNISNAVISAWRGDGEWFNWFWQIANYDSAHNSFTFGRGGFQGGEGSDHGGRWYIENVMEELDYPEEYFYNPATQKLYYFYNGTGSPPSSTAFAAANLTQLFLVRGGQVCLLRKAPPDDGQEYPVRNVGFSGIKFTASAPTNLAPHGVPSGGDWGLEPQGALTFIGTIGTTVADCVFERLDGNAIFVGGYNRNVSIKDSEFVFIGNNAVALWGNTEYYDGTNGDQPRFTSMTGCLCHEIGHYEKQSSCWFQAKSARSLVHNNVMFNMPRAAININDGFGGGNDISGNLVFNTCRESSDHGPFNSRIPSPAVCVTIPRDRVPFLTMEKDGVTPSLEPAYNNIHHNFMVANYGADGGCVDNDDGSSWYNMYSNFFIYGGHKSDFDGHCKHSYSNVMLYPNVYGARCIGLFGMPHKGFEEGFWNNTCVLQQQNAVYAALDGCKLTDPDTWTIIAHSNSLYAPGASASVQCGATMSLAQWQKATGLDQGSTVGDSPSVPQMMQWGRAVLSWA